MSYELKQTILFLDDVEVGYKDEKPILKNITLCEKDIVRKEQVTGQTIAILGRSGRGKSTLFKALTGLLKPTKGQVLVSNFNTEDPNDAKEVAEGDVGFVDQKYTLFRHKTVDQILQYSLRKTKGTKEEKEKIIDKYLSEWGLTTEKNKYSCDMSGGQRQRVAIIEQIIASNHFIIFDEPFSGLDVGNIEKVKCSFDLISKQDELNTIIFSTHDINLAVELADSIYIIGYPEGTKEYSTIVKHYDLKELGLAWKKFGVDHLELVTKIKEDLLKS